MADMNLQIKISSQFEEAVEAVQKLNKSFSSLITEITASAAALEIFKKAGASVSQFGKSISELSGSMKKFGKDFSKYVSGPLILLAGLSLKKVFDEAISGRGSANADAFAVSIQSLKRNFDELLITIGDRIAPIVTKFINFINAMIIAFNRLSPEMQQNIIIFAGIAAAIGPVILGISAFLGIVGKLVFAFGQIISAGPAILAFFTNPLTAAFVLATAIGSLINLFNDLTRAGVGSGEAIYLSFKTASTYLSEKFYSGLSKIVAVMAELNTSDFKGSGIDDIINGKDNLLTKTANSLADVSDLYGKEFDRIKADVNAKLAPIGTDLGNSLSFGITGAIAKAKESLKELTSEGNKGGVVVKLRVDVATALINAKDALNKVKQDALSTNLELERLQFDHENKMNNIRSTSGDVVNQEIFDKQKEFLVQKQELQIQEIEAERAKNIAIANLETDKTARSLGISTAESNYKITLAKTVSQQQIEIANATAAAEEALLQKRQEAINKFAEPAASGLAQAFTSIADGTKTAGEALNDFTRDFLAQMTQMILKAYLLQAITSAIGGFGGGGGGGGGRNPGQTAQPGTFAKGGFVTGPGNGTSDSIPAYLSNGEFVMKAAAVKNLGLGFLHGLNNIGRSGVKTKSKNGVRAFADGGLVTSAASAPQVVIQNTGSPKQASSTEFDPGSATTTIILEDINRNGPIAKGFQSTFGMKRRIS